MNTLDKLRSHPRVEFVDLDEPNSVIITLRQGWTWDVLDDNRVSSEGTASAALQAVRQRAMPFAGPYTE